MGLGGAAMTAQDFDERALTEAERKAIYPAIERIGRLESKDAKLIPRALVDRITELESRMAEGGLKDGQTLRARVSANEAWANTADDRIEALEALGTKLSSTHYDVHGKLNDRIDALEAHHMTTLAERWWRTHDAALSGCEASAAVWHDENAMYEHCVACADRAHGPLEAPDTVALLDAHRLTVEHAALVKAAQELCVWCDTHLATSTSGRLTALHEALKPFEPEPKPISGAEFVDGMEEEIHKRNTEVDALVKACRELERRFNSVIRGDPEHVEFVAALKPFQVKP